MDGAAAGQADENGEHQANGDRRVKCVAREALFSYENLVMLSPVAL